MAENILQFPKNTEENKAASEGKNNSVIQFPKNPEEFLEAEKTDKILEERKSRISQLNHYRGEATSRNAIRLMKDIKVGDIFWVTLDKRAYIVSDKKGRRITISALDENASLSTGLSFYEFSEAVAKRMLPIDDNEEYIEELAKSLKAWYEGQKDTKYLMLYGRKIHYFTLFLIEETPEKLPSEILETLKAIGNVVSMDIDEDVNAVEIWIRTDKNNVEQLYLFPYDKGIIKV